MGRVEDLHEGSFEAIAAYYEVNGRVVGHIIPQKPHGVGEGADTHCAHARNLVFCWKLIVRKQSYILRADLI